MPEDACAPRIAALTEQAKALESRATQLAALDDTEPAERATAADIAALRDEMRAALKHATPIRAKTILQAMIDGIRVDGRDSIEPTYRIPAVREPCGSMGETWQRANHTLMAAPAIGVG